MFYRTNFQEALSIYVLFQWIILFSLPPPPSSCMHSIEYNTQHTYIMACMPPWCFVIIIAAATCCSYTIWHSFPPTLTYPSCDTDDQVPVHSWCLERLAIMAYWPFLYSLLPPSFHPVNCEAAVGPPLLAPSWLFFLTVFVFYWALPPIAANAILVGNSQSIIIASFLIIRYSLLCHATMWIAAQTITQRPPIPHTRTISNRVHQNHCGVWCHWSDILHPPTTNPKTTNMVPTSISRDNHSTG